MLHCEQLVTRDNQAIIMTGGKFKGMKRKRSVHNWSAGARASVATCMVSGSGP